MAATWQTDPTAAADWAADQTVQVGNERDWSPDWVDFAIDLVESVRPSATSLAFEKMTGVSWDAGSSEEYFAELAEAWSGQLEGASPPVGWDQLGNVWASAGNASYTASEEQRLGTVVPIVVGTVTESAKDIGEGVSRFADFFSGGKSIMNPKGYKFWVPVVGAGALWLLLRK